MNKDTYLQITVCGVAAVDAVLAEHPERIDRFFFSRDRSARYGEICSRLANEKKIYRLVEESELEKITDSVHHQGVATVISYPVPRLPEKEDVQLWGKENRTVLILDGVSNTHNLGTMVRTAAFLGIQDIVVCGKSTQASKIISPSMYRSAEGGMEHCTIWRHDSAAEFLKAYPFQASPGLMAIAADQYSSRELRELPAQINMLPGASEGRISGTATALVMGNEEEGLSKGAKAACLYSARISGEGKLESLNVAQAAAIFMYWFAKPSGAKPSSLGKPRSQGESSQGDDRRGRPAGGGNDRGHSHGGARPRPAGAGYRDREGGRDSRDSRDSRNGPRDSYREGSRDPGPGGARRERRPFDGPAPGKKVRTIRLKKKPEDRK